MGYGSLLIPLLTVGMLAFGNALPRIQLSMSMKEQPHNVEACRYQSLRDVICNPRTGMKVVRLISSERQLCSAVRTYPCTSRYPAHHIRRRLRREDNGNIHLLHRDKRRSLNRSLLKHLRKTKSNKGSARSRLSGNNLQSLLAQIKSKKKLKSNKTLKEKQKDVSGKEKSRSKDTPEPPSVSSHSMNESEPSPISDVSESGEPSESREPSETEEQKTPRSTNEINLTVHVDMNDPNRGTETITSGRPATHSNNQDTVSKNPEMFQNLRNPAQMNSMTSQRFQFPQVRNPYLGVAAQSQFPFQSNSRRVYYPGSGSTPPGSFSVPWGTQRGPYVSQNGIGANNYPIQRGMVSGGYPFPGVSQSGFNTGIGSRTSANNQQQWAMQQRSYPGPRGVMLGNNHNVQSRTALGSNAVQENKFAEPFQAPMEKRTRAYPGQTNKFDTPSGSFRDQSSFTPAIQSPLPAQIGLGTGNQDTVEDDTVIPKVDIRTESFADTSDSSSVTQEATEDDATIPTHTAAKSTISQGDTEKTRHAASNDTFAGDDPVKFGTETNQVRTQGGLTHAIASLGSMDPIPAIESINVVDDLNSSTLNSKRLTEEDVSILLSPETTLALKQKQRQLKDKDRLSKLSSEYFIKTLQTLNVISVREKNMLERIAPKWKKKDRITKMFQQLMRRKYFRKSVARLLERDEINYSNRKSRNAKLIISLLDLTEEKLLQDTSDMNGGNNFQQQIHGLKHESVSQVPTAISKSDEDIVNKQTSTNIDVQNDSNMGEDDSISHTNQPYNQIVSSTLTDNTSEERIRENGDRTESDNRRTNDLYDRLQTQSILPNNRTDNVRSNEIQHQHRNEWDTILPKRQLSGQNRNDELILNSLDLTNLRNANDIMRSNHSTNERHGEFQTQPIVSEDRNERDRTRSRQPEPDETISRKMQATSSDSNVVNQNYPNDMEWDRILPKQKILSRNENYNGNPNFTSSLNEHELIRHATTQSRNEFGTSRLIPMAIRNENGRFIQTQRTDITTRNEPRRPINVPSENDTEVPDSRQVTNANRNDIHVHKEPTASRTRNDNESSNWIPTQHGNEQRGLVQNLDARRRTKDNQGDSIFQNQGIASRNTNGRSIWPQINGIIAPDTANARPMLRTRRDINTADAMTLKVNGNADEILPVVSGLLSGLETTEGIIISENKMNYVLPLSRGIHEFTETARQYATNERYRDWRRPYTRDRWITIGG